MINSLVKLLGNSKKTIYRWKEEKRPIIDLLEKYFTKEEINEYVETGSIAKMESFNHYELTLNIEFNTFYREKLDSSQKPYLIRFFWDFITRYKEELIEIEIYNCKNQLNKILLDYHLVLIELCKNTYSNDTNSLTIKYYSEFMSLLINLSDDLIYFIIYNIKSTFKPHINYLISNSLYAYAIEILSSSIVDYYDDKAPDRKELKGRIFIKEFHSNNDKYSKEFYFQIKDYLDNYSINKKEIFNLIENSKDNDRLK